MIILPAIDMKGGKCVRLYQGRADRETVFDEDPTAVARRWVEQGAEYLHLVDLDGAFEGRPKHGDLVAAIVKAAAVPIEIGGGIRAREAVSLYLEAGVDRVILGTRALESRQWLAETCQAFPERIAVGIDAKDGYVATHGWIETSGTRAEDFARSLVGLPIAALIFTDISRDGAMRGANLDAVRSFAEAAPHPVIASGGVSTLDDVKALASLGVAGAIIGRALYDGRIDLREAIAAAAP